MEWGLYEGQYREEGKSFFWHYPADLTAPPPPTHLYGLEAWLNCSVSPQRAVNHTLSNAERWLQAPSAFIINHWHRKDMSPHLQNHWSSNCGRILPENDFSASATAHGALGAKPRGVIPWGSILQSRECFLDLILPSRLSWMLAFSDFPWQYPLHVPPHELRHSHAQACIMRQFYYLLPTLINFNLFTNFGVSPHCHTTLFWHCPPGDSGRSTG